MLMGPKRKPCAVLMKEWYTLRGKNTPKLIENSQEESDRMVVLIPLAKKQGEVRSSSVAPHQGTKFAATCFSYQRSEEPQDVR